MIHAQQSYRLISQNTKKEYITKISQKHWNIPIHTNKEQSNKLYQQ